MSLGGGGGAFKKGFHLPEGLFLQRGIPELLRQNNRRAKASGSLLRIWPLRANRGP